MFPNVSGSANNGNGHLNVPGDEVPPPPYSETDVYSNSGSSRSHTASAPSVAASATAAAATPLHSFIDDAASSTADETIYTPPLTPRTSPGSAQPAATLYFDLRPAPQQDSGSDMIRMTLVHTIEVDDASRPDDFPYESDWAGRDVTALDWSTFINFLIPDHTTRQNEAVIHRKLLDEMRSESGNTNDSTAQVEAQLNQIADARDPANPESLRRRRDVEATVQQWNDGFFGPRGIQVRLEPPRTPSAQMPGTWEPNFDQASEAGRSTQPSQTAGRSAPAGCGSWGGFQIDDNGVRYGNSFVADQNGLRIGNLVMDQRGIRFQNDAAQQQQQQPAADADRDVRGRTTHQYGGDEKADHKRSSSASSTSSSSSSSSESSIGSLPSYDDIPVNSVQLYIARLQDWTKNPDQLRTKGDIKQLKAELKSIPKCQDVPLDVDKKALKAQIKTLTTIWRQVKKNQRRERKALRKERRGKRKAERKEKRQHRKDMRKARKEARRGQSTPVPPVPPPPPPPAIPPMPPHVPGNTVPPVPPVPSVNTPPWTGSFPWGRPHPGRGGRGGRGGHHHHPHPHPHQQHYGLPRGGGWGAWNNPQGSNGKGPSDESGMFGSRGPFGPEGPFGPGGPFGEKGIFGSDGLFGPKGFFGPGQDEQHTQQLAEQQRELAEQQRQQHQQHAEQQRQQAEQQREHYQQQAEQQRQQQQQHAEQQRQHYQQQAEQARQHLQQHQQQQWQQYHQQRQASASSAHSLPGSWPDEKKQQPASASQDGDEQIPPPGPRASAKYNTIGALERTIQAQTAAAEKAEGLQKEQVEKAIATMKKQLESLRVQADEEYAKELSGN
ncbi:hypothetical protein GGI35DRAFT_452890 [Trichoderma velutinum]